MPLAEETLQLGERISYIGFRSIFIGAWLLVIGALVCIAARVRVGFVLLVGAGVALAILGMMLAPNSGDLSDRMVKEVQSRGAMLRDTVDVALWRDPPTGDR